jgi:hypothetical protein
MRKRSTIDFKVETYHPTSPEDADTTLTPTLLHRGDKVHRIFLPRATTLLNLLAPDKTETIASEAVDRLGKVAQGEKEEILPVMEMMKTDMVIGAEMNADATLPDDVIHGDEILPRRVHTLPDLLDPLDHRRDVEGTGATAEKEGVMKAEEEVAMAEAGVAEME